MDGWMDRWMVEWIYRKILFNNQIWNWEKQKKIINYNLLKNNYNYEILNDRCFLIDLPGQTHTHKHAAKDTLYDLWPRLVDKLILVRVQSFKHLTSINEMFVLENKSIARAEPNKQNRTVQNRHTFIWHLTFYLAIITGCLWTFQCIAEKQMIVLILFSFFFWKICKKLFYFVIIVQIFEFTIQNNFRMIIFRWILVSNVWKLFLFQYKILFFQVWRLDQIIFPIGKIKIKMWNSFTSKTKNNFFEFFHFWIRKCEHYFFFIIRFLNILMFDDDDDDRVEWYGNNKELPIFFEVNVKTLNILNDVFF